MRANSPAHNSTPRPVPRSWFDTAKQVFYILVILAALLLRNCSIPF